MTEQSPRAGAIHNIGFRRYEGPLLGRRWAFRTLVLDTVRGSFGIGRAARAKVIPFALGAIIFFPVVVVLFQLFVIKETLFPYAYSELPGNMWLFITAFVAGRAPLAVSRDLRSGVLPLYMSRPLLRSDYVWARYLGVVIAVALIITAPLLVMYAGSLLAGNPFVHETAEFGRGLAAMVLVAVVVPAIAVLLAAVAPRRGWGIAIIVSFFVILNAVTTTAGIVISEGASPTVGRLVQILDPFDAASTLVVRALGATQPIGSLMPEGIEGGLAAAAVLAGFLALSLGLLHLRYRKVGTE